MIIFDLDTLANSEHRRHFVDAKKRSPNGLFMQQECGEDSGVWRKRSPDTFELTNEIWYPDWKSYYESCDKDVPIKQTIHLLEYIGESEEYGCDAPYVQYENIQIWTGRCESVREQTEIWMHDNVKHSFYHSETQKPVLKMRQLGDDTPLHQLMERWLDAMCDDLYSPDLIEKHYPEEHDIEMVFSSNPEIIKMFHRRGIFVFDCNQKVDDA